LHPARLIADKRREIIGDDLIAETNNLSQFSSSSWTAVLGATTILNLKKWQ